MDQLFCDFSVDKQNILLMTNALFFNLKLTFLSLLTFLAFSSTGYTSQSVEVQLGAAKDNTLYESATGALSNGAGSYFFAGKTFIGSIRRAVIAFDIAGSIPTGATIQTVTLKLYMSRTIAANENIALNKLVADWGEGTSNAPDPEGGGTASTTNDATWLHRFFDTVFWNNSGGDYISAASVSTTVADTSFYTFGSTTMMVSDVQDWLDNSGNNFGWILIGNEEVDGTTKRFDTKENPVSANRPVLTVTYLPPCCIGLRGDFDGDGNNATFLDLDYLVDYIFRGGPAPPCPEEADINNDGRTSTALDIAILIDVLYRGGAAPDACP